jgi:hypothetical protein
MVMQKNQTVVKEKHGKRYLQATTVATAFALPVLARAAGETPVITPDTVTQSVNGIGMPALIGAAVVAMLAIAVLIWGGKRIIGFFSK